MASHESAFDILMSLDLVGKPCTRKTGKELFDIHAVIDAMMKMACAMSEKVLYDYQQEFYRRVMEAILLHEGDMLTALWSRQSGKTECIGAIAASAMVMLPELAKQFPDDWRLNITDEMGRYRGYSKGINFGIYAPILDQSQIMFDRIRGFMETDSSASILQELGLGYRCVRGSVITLTNGSSILAMSASPNSKIEGHTHHVVIAEEAQDIDTLKIRKSIHPMIASTKGCIVKIGTAAAYKGDFYHAIKMNKRKEIASDKRHHFYYPWSVCCQSNSMYKEYIEGEKLHIGENSDEFRMAYNCEWMLERGMFVVDKYLLASGVAVTQGKYSELHKQFSGTNLIAGIDLGKENDPTVVAVMDVDWTAPAVVQTIVRDFQETDFVAYNKHVVAWLCLHGDDYEHQYHEIVDWLSNFRPLRKIIMDATRESSLADRFRHTQQFRDVEVEDFVFTLQSKAAGYRLLHNDILSRRFTFPAGEAARKTMEYRGFLQQTLDLTKTYNGEYMQVAHPNETGAHDDYPDATMLANWGADTPTADMSLEIFSGNAFTS